MTLGENGIHVTLDWGTPKVHLASGEKQLMRHALADPESYVEVAVCGYVQADHPREGAEDEVDAENICARCLLKRNYFNEDH
jgi:hypothetical protein